MHALIVTANPNAASLTHAVSKKIADTVSQSGPGHGAETADLAKEGFDPCFTSHDLSVLHGEADPLPEIIVEQQRIDRADALVLVHPVYWWSFPALLKGWIDRVFTNGWAYDDTSGNTVIHKLTHLSVHMVSIAGASMRTYAVHGYYGAMRTQINHGIFGYCGARVRTSALLFQSDPTACLDRAREIGKGVVAP